MIDVNLQYKILELFKPLNIEFREDYFIVTATTGKYIAQESISYFAIEVIEDKTVFISKVKDLLHYQIEQEMFKKRYEEVNPHLITGNYIMIDTMCPVDRKILVMHPEKYQHYLKTYR